jgi:hypothetical protein
MRERAMEAVLGHVVVRDVPPAIINVGARSW